MSGAITDASDTNSPFVGLVDFSFVFDLVLFTFEFLVCDSLRDSDLRDVRCTFGGTSIYDNDDKLACSSRADMEIMGSDLCYDFTSETGTTVIGFDSEFADDGPYMIAYRDGKLLEPT